jgi:putative ABC transport system permease protein
MARAGPARETVMRTLRNDIVFAVRSLRKSSGLTLVAILSLAFGIGVNTAAFSVIHPVLLAPLPYPDSDRLVLVAETNTQRGYDWFPVAPRNFQHLAEQGEIFEYIAALEGWSGALTGSGPAATVDGIRASTSFFQMIGVEAVLGRTFLPDEDESSVILSDGLWRSRFGANPEVAGSTITIDQSAYTVIGVLPRDFRFGSGSYELWRPLQREFAADRMTFHSLQIVAKLREGIGPEQANGRLEILMQQLAEQYPKANAGWGARVQGLHEFFASRNNVRPALLAITIAVGFILLMACINVANLQLARAAAREKEIAVRAALGARRGTLIRQLLTESAVLALAGGALGFLLAYWSMSGLRQVLPDMAVFDANAFDLDGGVAAFTLAASMLTAIGFGLVPALRTSNVELSQTLREGGRSAVAGLQGRRFHNVLVVAEIALAMLVLVGAGLTLNSFLRLQHIDKGFISEKLLTLRVNLLDYKYPEEQQWPRFFGDAIERIRRVPGVVSAAAIDLLPMRNSTGWFFDFTIQSKPAPDGAWPNAASRTVTPGYFATMGIPLLRGREFTEQDDDQTPGVIVINDVLATQFFPNEDPIGQRIHLSSRDPEMKWLEIVGVVPRVRQWSFGTQIFGKEAGDMPAVYRPYRQLKIDRMSFVVRTTGDPAAIAGPIQDQIWALDKDQPITGVRTMDEYILRAHSGPQLNLILASIFGGLALLLAVSGIYGVMSYTVRRRSHEMGVRMALGAKHGDIFRMVLRQAMTLTCIGLGLGLLAALGLTRFLAGMLYEVSPTDIVTLIGVSAFLTLVALAASFFPALRATAFDPLRNLRAE